MDNAPAALKSGSFAIVSGRTVTLTPATPVRFGQTATLSYTDAAGDQSGVVEDLAGNDAPTFTDRGVTNNVAATDATLFGLALADGTTDVPLTPAFASGTFSYTASVAYSVSSVTVTATPNHGGARYELLDGSNTAIDDADGNTPGDQVSLAEGVNTIKVKVTAADGSTTQTYTVTVTRQASDAPANLRATPGSEQVALSWDAPDSSSGVIRHEYRYKPVDGDYPATWTEIPNSAVGEANEDGVTITGLDNGALYTFQVRAVDADGAGTPAETTDGPHPAVSIVAVNAGGDAIARIDVAEFRVTRTGSTSAAVDVSVRVAQTESFLADSLLSQTVTIPAGRSSERLLFYAGQFSSTVSADGVLTAVVAAGTGYVPGVPAAAAISVRVAEKPVQVLYGEDGYTVDEDIGTLDVELSAHVAHGLPKPDWNVEVALSTREHGLEGQRAARREDYRAVSTTVTFRPADFRNKNKQGFWIARKTVSVPIVDDALDEEDFEWFYLALQGLPITVPGVHRVYPSGEACYSEVSGLTASCLAPVLIRDNDGPLSEQQMDEPGAPLTAAFKDLPAAHDGSAPFTFELALSENIEGLSYEKVRDNVLDVTGGRVTNALRLAAPSNRRWAVTVKPGGEGEVSIALPPTTDCEAEGALCTADGRMLANGVAHLIVGPAAAPEPEPLPDFTVRFESVPDTHDGESPVVFRLAFSEEPASDYSYARLRDRTLNVWQGSRLDVRRARRLDAPSNRRWEVTVAPVSKADLTVGLGPTHDCADNGAVCTEDGRMLANHVHKVIKGPPGISVADARVEEAADATVDFAVSLSRAASETVTVQYATSDGTATAGSDYTQTSGTLTFTAGESSKTISVPVLDDAHDEGEETFTLTLSNASGGGAWLKDATATGTIENDDPMPQAWLARFGRTVASQAVDAIGGRMEGAGGSHVTVGGMQLDSAGKLVEPEEKTSLSGDFESLRWNPIDETRSMTSRELLLGSSFQLSAGGENGAPSWTGWGHFATGGFEADVDGTPMDGDVTTGFLGADVGADRWLAGIALSLTEGDGDFSLLKGDDKGTVESSLSALYPYAKLGVSDTVDVWGLVGFGSGELELTLLEDANRMQDETYKTDIGMRMGALGVRGEVLSPADSGGLSVAVKSDAFWVRTDSDAVEPNQRHGKLAASEADASRVRLIVEGSRAFDTGNGTLTPSAEVGVRYDGGDAETGTGIELGGALRYQGAGVTIEGAVRTLLAHEESGYEEWGASGAIRIQPGSSGRGLSFTLSPTWGAASSGVGRLWGLRDAQGLASDGEFEAESRLEAEIGYGIGVPHSRGLVTPYTALSLAQGGSRTWRTGARWKVAPDSTLGLEATRQEGRGDETAENAIVFRVQTRW